MVVGIFDINHLNAAYNQELYFVQQWLFNSMFVPNYLPRRGVINDFQAMELWHGVFNREGNWGEQIETPENLAIQTFFVLENWNYISQFEDDVLEILSEFFIIENNTEIFQPLENGLNAIAGVSVQMLIFSIATGILVISLVMTLLIRERRFEFGVYLALGEDKKKILLQMILETVFLFVIGSIGGMLIGVTLAEMISQELLQGELVVDSARLLRNMPSEMHFRGLIRQLTVEELVEFLTVRYNAMMFVNYFLIGLGTTLLATILPSIYILELKPKNLLAEKE